MDRVLDNTALSAYTQCPTKYRNSMHLHRRSKHVSAALEYGKCIHTLFEVLYKTHDAELAKAVAEVKYAETLGQTTDYRTLDRACLVFDEWLLKWGNPGDALVMAQERTLGWPDTPMAELSTNVVLPLTGLPYAVRIDRVYEADDAYFIEDHKTTSMFGATFYDEFQLSGQMMGYARAASLLIGKPIRGVRINVVCTRKNNSEFDKRLLYFSDEQLEAWELNLAKWHGRIKSSIEQDEWPKSFSNCSTKYGMCSYHEVCATGPSYEMAALEQDFDYAPWDPNAQHDD